MGAPTLRAAGFGRLHGGRSGRYPAPGETIVVDHEEGRVHTARYDDYPSTKDEAVEEVVKAYSEGAADVRGGMCNLLLNFAASQPQGIDDDVCRLIDALTKLAKLYEGPR